MIREVVVVHPKKALAPNGHHSLLAVSFEWKKPGNVRQTKSA